MAMRALSKDYETASLMGIDINRIISITFCWFLSSSCRRSYVGTNTAIDANGCYAEAQMFYCCSYGGIGNITGAVIGGFILGWRDYVNPLLPRLTDIEMLLPLSF